MNDPKCDECDDPGPYRCHGIAYLDDGSVRGCAKLLCRTHIAGTARIHFNPGGLRTVGYCGSCWEERQRFIAKRQAEIAAKQEAMPSTAPGPSSAPP